MEKKPHKPMPVPIPKPIPKPPMKPCHPCHPAHPVQPMHPVPCIPCDEKLIEQLYNHLKMCHKHEMEIIHMIRRYCKKRPRKNPESPRHWWDSPYDYESPYRRRNPHRYESPHHRHPYESSSFR